MLPVSPIGGLDGQARKCLTVLWYNGYSFRPVKSKQPVFMRLERDKVRNSRFQVASECSNTAWLHWNTILSLSGHISVFKTIRYRNRSKLSEIIIVINYTVHFWYTSLFNMSSRTNRKACSTAWLSIEDIRCRVREYFPSSRVEARGAFQSKFLPMCRISQIARSVP